MYIYNSEPANLIMLKNSHVTNYLDYYCTLSNSPEFAVMLRGNWGSGKSWFIKKYIESHSPENFLYVSLYGVTSYAEIEESFFAQLHPFLASKGMKFAGKLLKGVIKTTIKIDLDTAKKDELTIGGGLPDIRLPDYLSKLDGKILVFDDLERCSIPIYQIMGYINQFVETSGMKTILVANEDEIVKLDEEQDSKDNARRYLTIKEKLVGKSFEIETDMEAALDDFIGLVPDEESRAYLNTHKFLIVILFIMAGYKNLRHLKQALLDFDRFYELLDNEVKNCEDLMDHLFNLFLLISFEIKKGAIHEDDLEQLFSFSHLVRKETDGKSKTQVIRAKYPIFKTFGFHPLEGSTWTRLFKAGTVDRNELNQELKATSYLSKEEQPEWKRLYFFKSLKDEELNPVFDVVYAEFAALSINNPYYIIQITGILLFLTSHKLIEFDQDTIIQLGKGNLNAMKARGELEIQNPDEFPGDHSHSLGYAGIEQTEFKAFLKYAADMVKQNELEKQPIKAGELMSALKTSVKSFTDKLKADRPANLDYVRFPVLKHVDAVEFVDHFLTLSNSDKIAISDALETRYSYSYSRQLQPEKAWLQEVLELLTAKKGAYHGKISGYDLEHIIIPAISKSISTIPDTQ
ncbi:KAP-like P-loop domain-containing protein [Mucilaginibacter gracilis]|uniref:KAP-like P-loop domain-containing protein n=2 Tax=Mucilaginibacter gracilis TaxID=423350 RepID=A0A495ITI0_9SPHI|nr:KAP-like P-loop domain-containing protein [Mucilaginibacter gracilis]